VGVRVQRGGGDYHSPFNKHVKPPQIRAKCPQTKSKPKPTQHQPSQPVKFSTPDPETHGIPLDPILTALENEITPQNEEEDVILTSNVFQLNSGENKNQQQFNLPEQMVHTRIQKTCLNQSRIFPQTMGI
jgi:hypothetical protein